MEHNETPAPIVSESVTAQIHALAAEKDAVAAKFNGKIDKFKAEIVKLEAERDAKLAAFSERDGQLRAAALAEVNATLALLGKGKGASDGTRTYTRREQPTSDHKDRVMRALRKGGVMARSEIAKSAEIDDSDGLVGRTLEKLRDAGLVAMEGAKGGARYRSVLAVAG